MPLSRIEPSRYEELLAEKVQTVKALFTDFDHPEIEVFSSPTTGFRMRAEFRVWHEGDDLYYAMFKPGQPKEPHRVDEFLIAAPIIQRLMPELLAKLKQSPMLRERLFQVEFLSTQTEQVLVGLIYHRRLDEDWEGEARQLADELGIQIIGRSKKQKLTLEDDFVEERLIVNEEIFYYRQYEQSFTQPNATVNQKMIGWAQDNAKSLSGELGGELNGDLLELYCGNGNFTLPLSKCFNRVLATEISKTSVRAAHYNLERNKIENIDIVRMSAEDISQALAGVRPFRRLKETPLSDFNFSTVFVDPPRAGLDPLTEELVTRFDNILYISCNPETLSKNLEVICKTHKISRMAFFDQFPYTDHMESGVFLQRKGENIAH